MNRRRFLQLVRKGEGERVEFKSSLASEKAAIESLGAFANTRGGSVLFGVADSGEVLGVQLGNNSLENFANAVRRLSQPPLSVRIVDLTVHDKKVVAATVDRPKAGDIFHAFNTARIRVGRTNQVMSPSEQQSRYFAKFSSDVRQAMQVAAMDESWDEREKRRVETYQRNRGLFLVHAWRPSAKKGQIADIVIELRQHEGPDTPLTDGKVKSVEYHLGPKFRSRTFVKTNRRRAFRFRVSAYGPVLCLARVNFDDGTPPLDLTRYIDF